MNPCCTESVNTPGSVQPHGLLMSLDPGDTQVVQVCDNVTAITGLPMAEVLGCAPEQFMHVEGAGGLSFLIAAAKKDGCESFAHAMVRAGTQPARRFDLRVHSRRGVTILELEPSAPAADDLRCLPNASEAVLARLAQPQTDQALADVLVEEIRGVCNLDRVMVYRFDKLWNGLVIAESKNEKLESYRGHKFPAGDIPAHARQTFRDNWVRTIRDITATPARLIPNHYPPTGQPLDLGCAMLRSSAPVHLQYLANMRVRASLTISLIVEGELWGLIVCHHAGPWRLSQDNRHFCALVGRYASSRLETLKHAQHGRTALQLQRVNTSLRQAMAEAPELGLALTRRDFNVLSLLPNHPNASAAVFCDGTWRFLGSVPSFSELHGLTTWLDTQCVSDDPVFASDHLVSVYPAAEEFCEIGSGLLAFYIDKEPRTYVLWFLPEVIRNDNWAAHPASSAATDIQTPALHRPHSFELRKEAVRQHSLPLGELEVGAARQLRQFMLECDLQRQVDNERFVRGQLQEERRRLRLLSEATVILNRQGSAPVSLQAVADFLVGSFCDWIVIYTKDHDALLRTAIAHASSNNKDHAKVLWMMPAAEFSHIFKATGSVTSPLYWPTVESDALQAIFPHPPHLDYVTEDLGLTSLIVAPILMRGEVAGYIVYTRANKAYPFLPGDVEFAMQINSRVASCLENIASLEEKQRAVAMRDQVLGIVSHDLRNPLGVVRMTTENVLKRVERSDTASWRDTLQKAMNRILAASQRMETLIADLLNLGKMDANCLTLDQASYSCAFLANEVVEHMEPFAQQAQVHLAIVAPLTDMFVRCDKERIAQVLVNLVSNAIKYSDQHSTVTIAWRAPVAGQVEFCVTDSGPGIPQEELSHVFDRFWRSQDGLSKEGTGLGLAIVKALVEAHGGQVSVRSTLGKGTSFFFTLDAGAAAAGAHMDAFGGTS